VSCEAALGSIWNDRAYLPRAPLRHVSTTDRASDKAASFRLAHPPPASPCGAPRADEQDASDRLLLPITLSTNTRASSIPGPLPGETGCFTAPRSLRRTSRLLSAWGVFFPAPRRSAVPLVTPLSSPEVAAWSRLTSSALPSRPRETETDSSGIPVTGPRHPRPRVPSIDKSPSPSPVCREGTGPRPWLFPSHAVLHAAARFSPLLRSRRPSLLACAIGEGPPLARPRPRELAVRLEEDPAHASLGQATPDDFCNSTRRAGTPLERPILVREPGERQPLFPPPAHATAPNPRCCFPATSRASSRRLSPPRRARAEGARAKGPPCDGRAPLLEPVPRAPGSPHLC